MPAYEYFIVLFRGQSTAPTEQEATPDRQDARSTLSGCISTVY